MPLTQDDVDANPELSVFVMRQTTVLLCETLRRLSLVAQQHPHLSAAQALRDAAAMFEASMDSMTTRFGGNFSTSKH